MRALKDAIESRAKLLAHQLVVIVVGIPALLTISNSSHSTVTNCVPASSKRRATRVAWPNSVMP